ncbi:hypothetical protein BJI69_19590 [Luteibacter rhizovicinus DSM 16549]|uniref:Uncharacterized protein n=1 Tax=Luteibacter rhizovicinus DSM 16549 TaxID=1440763 RepID=A0A0G9HC16_9GAMM|nr:hypothetical protein [Luteibacter rhizovicinus]APG05889.1 hypothetical protein BJI69_19590 [Luteibacter rhizovicinus DSM 16549]KLD67163.1 hypothetical protein Y883_09410 [Luteibacter rhizovicinus DSM 16549]KLD73423.1 hypothetical protein Y886_38145 [Xanthomonas hyacinthi DSM 19077]
MIKRILLAALIGVTVTLLLIASSFAADDAGHETLSNVLFWQNWLLQALVPTPDIGAAEHPFAEGTPLTFIAWFASVPLGFVIYGVAAFAIMRRPKPISPAQSG